MNNKASSILLLSLFSCVPLLAQVPFQTLIGEEALAPGSRVVRSLPTSDGGVLIQMLNGEYQGLVKIGSDGQPLWAYDYTMDMAEPGTVFDLLATNDGGAYVITDAVFHTPGQGNMVLFVVVRLDANGTILWSKRFRSPELDAFSHTPSMALLQGNDLQITWFATGGSFPTPDYTYRISADGTVQWARKQSQGTSFDVLSVSATDADSDNGLVAMRVSFFGSYAVCLTRWAPDGTLLWTKHVRMTNSSWSFHFAGLLVAGSDDIYVFGEQFTDPLGTFPFLLKLDPAGELQWYRLYGSVAAPYSRPNSAIELPNTDIRFGEEALNTFTTDGEHVASVALHPPVWTSGSFSYSLPHPDGLDGLDRVLVAGSLARTDDVFAVTWTTPFLARIDLNTEPDCGWTDQILPLWTDTVVPSDYIVTPDDVAWVTAAVDVADTTVFTVPVALPAAAPYCAETGMGVNAPGASAPILTAFPNNTSAGSPISVVAPASGQLLVVGPEGRVVKSMPIPSAMTTTLNTDGFASGMYLLRLVRNDGQAPLVARLIVE